jgi:hypothetical protein
MADAETLNSQQYSFAAYLRDPDNVAPPADIEPRRLKIYTELFINNVTSLLGSTFPILAEILGEDRWAHLMRDFYREHKSHSPLFPDLPKEFLHYLSDERTADSQTDDQPDPPYMSELAHYEWVEAGLMLAEDQPPAKTPDPNGDLLEQTPVISNLAWLLSYMWPVHQINAETQPEFPADEPCYFVVYRQVDFKIEFVQLNAVSARLLELLKSQAPLTGRQALEQIAGELQHPDVASVVSAGEDILRQWHDLGIVLGSETT